MKKTLGAGFEMYTCKIENQSKEYKMLSLGLVVIVASLLILGAGNIVVAKCVELIAL